MTFDRDEFTDPAPGEERPQLQQRLLHLATQLDQMQSQLDELHRESQSGSTQIAALTKNLTDPAASQALQERLAELATQLENNSAQLEQLTQRVTAVPKGEQMEGLAQAMQQAASREQMDELFDRINAVARQEDVARLNEALTGTLAELPRRAQLEELANDLASSENVAELAAELKRLSRTQFKSNALSESKEQQTASALATLQEIATRRESISEERQKQDRAALETARAQARGDLAADLLPALDGVELALVNGRALLERHAVSPRPAPRVTTPQTPLAQDRGWLARLFGGEPEPAPAPPAPEPVADTRADEMRDALRAWLDGLDLVRDRFLKLLAAEDVQPIPAQGQPFDPHLHVAVETVTRSDVEPNSVVEVVRPGYRQRRRVLRYAEVIVARAE